MAVTIRSGSKTGSKTSSYANVRAAVASNAKQSINTAKTASKGSVKSTPAQVTPVTPTQQVVAEKKQTGTFDNPFFSFAGQKERLTNTGSVFKTIFLGGDRVFAVNPSTGIKGRDVTTASRVVIGAAALPLAYGAATTLAPGFLSGTSAATGVAARGASYGGLKALGLAAGVGVVAGSLLRGGGNAAPQTQSQAQNPSINTDSRQYNSQDSRQYNSQDTRYSIRDSPGASIAGSPSQSPYLAPNQTPTQSTPSSISASQQAEQSQALGQDWLIPALIAAGAIFLTRK